MPKVLSKFRFTLRNLVVYLTLSAFCLSVFAQPALAQTNQPLTPEEYQKRYQEYQKLQAEQKLTQPEQVSPTATQTATDSGETKPILIPALAVGAGLLGLCKIDDFVPGVGFLTDLVCDPFQKALSWFMNTVVKNLLHIVARIVLYVFTVLVTPLGFQSDQESVCAQTQTQSERDACDKSYEGIAALNPIFSDNSGLASKFNLFTVADGSLNSLYQAIPQEGSVTRFASEFNHNVLGIKVVNAQGAGTDLISAPMRSAWTKVRDLTYIAMVLVLVAIGFMVMFRKRLDPRTVVTATNSLPKVAIALVFITFSFAISGIFLDMIFILVDITRSWFRDIGDTWLSSGYLNTFSWISSKGGGEVGWLPFFTLISQSILRWGTMLVIIGSISLGVAAFTGPGGLVVGLALLIGLFAFELIIRLSIFIIAIILFWTLFQRFILMLVLTIFSPVFFLLGAIPGFESTPISWGKRMLAATLTFPLILIFVYIALNFLSPNIPGLPIAAGSTAKAPPPIGGAGYFLNIPALIGVGLILFALKVPAFIDDVLGIKDPLGKGGIGAGLLFAAAAVPGRGLKEVGSLSKGVSDASRGYYGLREKGQAWSRGLMRAGYQRGAPTTDPGTGAVVTPTGVPKTGLGARVAQVTRRLIPDAPGFRFRAPDANPGRPHVLPKEARDAQVKGIVLQDAERLRKPTIVPDPRTGGRMANPELFPERLGPVSVPEIEAIERDNKTVTTTPTTPDERSEIDEAEGHP